MPTAEPEIILLFFSELKAHAELYATIK